MSTTIVPYSAFGRRMRLANPYMRANRNVRAAYAIGRFMYRNRGKISKAARYIRKRRMSSNNSRAMVLYKRRRVTGAFSRGQKAAFYTFASGVFNEQRELLARKTLNIREFKFNNPPETNEQLRSAPGRTFHLSGLKICTMISNTSNIVPIRVHLAILQPKEFEANPTTFRDDFFVSDINTTQKFENFTDGGPWNMDYDCYGINRKKFNILTHTKHILRPRGDGTATESERENYKILEKYYKIGKRFEYDSNQDESVSKPLYAAIWYDSLLDTDQLAIGASVLGVTQRHTAYFRDST